MSDDTQQTTPEASSCPNCEQYLAGWKRALADYDNVKKDLAREKGLLRRAVSEEMVVSLLSVADHFDQATLHKPSSPEMDPWIQGILHIREELDHVLTAQGAQSFGREGDFFDPTLHESGSVRREPEKPDGMIIEVIHRGWRLGEKVIRPALVVVNILADRQEAPSTQS